MAACLAIVWLSVSPGSFFEMIYLLGRQETARRLRSFVEEARAASASSGNTTSHS
jgi:hypothetical protein